MNAQAVTVDYHDLVFKVPGVMPVSRELSEDTFDLIVDLRSMVRFGIAVADGRVVNRGGGWWRVNGTIARGRRQARALLDAEAQQ